MGVLLVAMTGTRTRKIDADVLSLVAGIDEFKGEFDRH
mgnify:FL=1